MAHRKSHWVGKPLISSNCGVTLVRRAFTLLFLAVVLSSGFVSVSNAALPIGSVGPTCVGDCDNSGAVTIDEIILGVRIALEDAPIGVCRPMDGDGNGAVAVNELVGAVTRALQGCSGPVPPTATNMPTATATPTPTVTRTSTTADTPTVRQAEQLGFGIRGDGRRVIDGELQQFQSDGVGNVLVDSESDVHALEIVVGSMGQPDSCTVTAALKGSLTSADFRAGTQFSTDLTDLHVVQPPQAGALLLALNGTVGTDCLGVVTLSTIEPLRVAPGDTCFAGGRLQAQREGGTVAVTYADSGIDLDFGADGSVNQHFAACTDVPADQCRTAAVGLCGACTAVNQCQGGLSCFSCSRNCTGNTRRCSLADTFVTCEDGVF